MSIERRLTHRLTQYWERARKDAPFPSYRKFNAAALDDIWQQCFCLRVTPSARGKITYTYEHFGEKLKEAYGKDMHGQLVTSALRHLPGSSIIRRVDQIFDSPPHPVYDEGKFMNEQHKLVKYRSCLLPFGEPDGRTTHIVCGLTWRVF